VVVLISIIIVLIIHKGIMVMSWSIVFIDEMAKNE
jgi:hypothetical protein